MTRMEILFNYRKAIRQAERLEEAARKIERLASDRMESTKAGLRLAWKSDNSPRFMNKMGKVQDDIRVDAKNIRKVAQGIRTTAENIRRAEERALEIAQARTYRS